MGRWWSSERGIFDVRDIAEVLQDEFRRCVRDLADQKSRQPLRERSERHFVPQVLCAPEQHLVLSQKERSPIHP
jgi:hypothetical protein